MSEKVLGKIDRISLGMGGYQDAMFGLHIDFKLSNGYHVSDGDCYWGYGIEAGKLTKWSESDREQKWGKIMTRIAKLCHQAKVDSFDKLKGIPVEVEIEYDGLKSWRILEEVL